MSSDIEYTNYLYKLKELCKSEKKSVHEFKHIVMQDISAIDKLYDALINLGFARKNSIYKNLEILYLE